MHADVTSFGLKWALWYSTMQRNIERFEMAAADVECGKISGAVGNFANTPPFVQDYVCEQLGIHSARISTQVLQRDRHAHYMGKNSKFLVFYFINSMNTILGSIYCVI